MDQRPTADVAATPSAGTTANIYLYLVVFAVASALIMLMFLVWV
jgi:hypothetical protein